MPASPPPSPPPPRFDRNNFAVVGVYASRHRPWFDPLPSYPTNQDDNRQVRAPQVNSEITPKTEQGCKQQ